MAERKLYPSEQQDRFIVRFPDGMRDKIGVAARRNKRSMNAEIVSRLEASFSSVELAVQSKDEDEDPNMLGSIFGSLIGLESQIKDLRRQSAEIKALITAPGGRGDKEHSS
jgi:hypothetical protein